MVALIDSCLIGLGINSFVRQALYPEYQLEPRAECTFTAFVPWEALQNDPALTNFTLNTNQLFRVGPGRCIVGAVVPPVAVMDLQLIDAEYTFKQTPELQNLLGSH